MDVRKAINEACRRVTQMDRIDREAGHTPPVDSPVGVWRGAVAAALEAARRGRRWDCAWDALAMTRQYERALEGAGLAHADLCLAFKGFTWAFMAEILEAIERGDVAMLASPLARLEELAPFDQIHPRRAA
jgi:hypothetical protein